ncbi:DNA-binding response regulator [Paenibacillus psychroresistens]|uniref:DNA-binding response regulator n=1 Tax=Paenibacillus psychroresistens TaxID=1778678 RepID=A0A6B8RES2_9BACL|nr:response regulator transcription factor [Paenibacillus psychroresistens]QGQ94670.1 DNA-binding response regulator [Paenibacillus psychroresistens]
MERKPIILVVQDDKPIRNLLCVSLNYEGYKCLDTESGKTAISLVSSHHPDLIIMDLNLPDMEGLDVIKQVRPVTKAAIIVVSVRGLEREKVNALDSGADDYLTKPFSLGELLARVRVAFRHLHQFSLPQNPTLFTVGELKIDFEKHRVFLSNEAIHLTPIEYKLIALMSKYPGRVLTYKFIMDEIWGLPSINDTKTLRVFMANIRRKIEKKPAETRYIWTEMGVGYRLADE